MTRRSVPTDSLCCWYAVGWAYVMPDFDKNGHSIVEWLSTKTPRVPAANRVPETTTENASHGSHDRTQHAGG